MRCPNCNHFVSLEMQDPEDQGTDFDPETGEITGSIRIVRCCVECGDELKDAYLELVDSFDEKTIEAHQGKGHALSAEVATLDAIEEGGSRYQKSFFGASATVELRCKCQAKNAAPLATLELSDSVAASEMDELV